MAEAVVEARPKRKKRKPKAPKPEELLVKQKLKGNYAAMSVKELRTLLNGKKKALLIKSGFPDGLVPRSKVAMISLCKKLKRKRW